MASEELPSFANGGPAALASLTEGLPRATNVAYYAGIVKEKALLRRLARAGDSILRDALDSSDPKEIIERADSYLQQASESLRGQGPVLLADFFRQSYSSLDEN